MGLLDEITPNVSKALELEAWLKGRPEDEREDWLTLFRRGDLYTNRAVAALLARKGFPADWNVVYRFRQKLDGYVTRR